MSYNFNCSVLFDSLISLYSICKCLLFYSICHQLTNWNAMMMESKEARIFCVRLIHKLSEALIGIKVR